MRAPGQVQRGSGKVLDQVQQGSAKVPDKNPVRLNRVLENVSQKVPEKVTGGFGAEPGEVQQGSGEGSGESSPEGSSEGRGALVQSQVRVGLKVREALVQSQVKFNRCQARSDSKRFCRARSGSTGFRRRRRRRSGRLWCRARSSSTGFRRRF